MTDSRWTSFDLIFFDCDSTLSTIEGIDELAKLKGKDWRVGLLTQKAMDGDLDLAEVYGKRLQAIRPTRGQLKAIEERYWETIVPDVQAVLDALPPHDGPKTIYAAATRLGPATLQREQIVFKQTPYAIEV